MKEVSLLKTGRNGGRFGALFAFCTFFLVPFLGGNDLALFYVQIDRFWIENTFGLLLVLSILIVYLQGGTDQSGFLRFSGYFLPFFLMHIVSLLYSWNSFGTLAALGTLVWAVGAVYLYLLSPNKEACLAGLVAGATGCAVAAIIQHQVLFPGLARVFQQGLYAQILKEQSGIPFSSYSYHNILGGYLAFVLPVAIYFAAYKEGVLRVLLSVVSAALVSVGIVLTSSRISLGLALVCIVVSLGFFLVTGGYRRVLRMSIVIALALAVSFSLLHGGATKTEPGVQAVIAQKAKNAVKDFSTLNTRTDIWKNALRAFEAKPLTGYGPGAFEFAYRKHFDGGSYTVVAHSTVVKIAVELGVVGLLCFLLYLFGVVRGVKYGQREPLEGFLIMSALAGFLFGLIDFSFDVTSHVITFFVITSTFVSATLWRKRRVNAWQEALKAIPVLLVILLLALGGFLFQTRVDAMRRSLAYADLLGEMGSPAAALAGYREAMGPFVLSMEPYIKAASVIGTMSEAETNEETRKAMTRELERYLAVLETARDRNSERFLIMGRCYRLLGNRERTEGAYGTALWLYPSSPFYAYEMGSYYLKAGEYVRALEAIRAFDRYVPKFRTPHNPRGPYVYRLRDLEASVELALGHREKALAIARQNLRDAEQGVYVITSSKARGFIERETMLEYLKGRVRYCENT